MVINPPILLVIICIALVVYFFIPTEETRIQIKEEIIQAHSLEKNIADIRSDLRALQTADQTVQPIQNEISD